MKYELPLTPGTQIPPARQYLFAFKPGDREIFIQPDELPEPGRANVNYDQFFGRKIEELTSVLYKAGYTSIRVETNVPPTTAHKHVGINTIIAEIERKERRQQRIANIRNT